MAWLADGLGVPDAVRAATRAYRDEMDPISDFLAERCVLDVAGSVPIRTLRAAYTDWAEDNGVRDPLGAKAFNERLRARDCEQDRKRTQWFGVRLRTADDKEPEPAGQMGQMGHSLRESPPRRAREESYATTVPFAPFAPSGDPTPAAVLVPCAGCQDVRARLTEFEGALWCPSCLHAKSSYRARPTP
jgi:phage/plasmid-associated DNA primase